MIYCFEIISGYIRHILLLQKEKKKKFLFVNILITCLFSMGFTFHICYRFFPSFFYETIFCLSNNQLFFIYQPDFFSYFEYTEAQRQTETALSCSPEYFRFIRLVHFIYIFTSFFQI